MISPLRRRKCCVMALSYILTRGGNIENDHLTSPQRIKWIYHSQALMVEDTSRSDWQSVRLREITAYPGFEDACTAFVADYIPRRGHGPKLFPKLGMLSGSCRRGVDPLLFSVTQENSDNTHLGSANYSPYITSYMSDFDVRRDLGKWVSFRISNTSPRTACVRLDTINYHQINVTGWPIQYGHLFASITDSSVKTTLDQSIFVEFDIRIPISKVHRVGYRDYSGHRVMIGMVGLWTEALPRRNQAHFLEVDLLQSADYAESYGRSRSRFCGDQRYDRCFYDEQGRYPEGREIPLEVVRAEGRVPEDPAIWTHIKIDLSGLFRRLKWVSPPGTWRSGQLRSVYFGIESQGTTETLVELRNYRAYIQNG